MTNPSTTRRAGPYIGTGALVSYPFNFKVFDKTDLRAVIADGTGVESDLVVDSSALITLNVDQEADPGGSLQYAVAGVATALPNGYLLSILSAVPYAQQVDLPEGGNYRAGDVENGLDSLSVQIQQLAEQADRALILSPLSEEGVSGQLPAPEAGMAIGWDDSGTKLVNLSPGGGGGGGHDSGLADLANTVSTAKGDALVGVKQPFAGGVGRTQHEKNIDTGLYADDFRLAGDPDDTLSMQRVMNLGRACLLRANKTYTAYGLVAVAGSALMCPLGEAKISVPAGAGRYGLLCEVSNFTLAGIWFSGGDEATSWNGETPTVIGDRDGVVIGKAFGTGAGINNITLRNLRLTGFNHAGLLGREVQVGMSFDKRVTLDNVIAYSNYVGLWYSPRFEYTTTTNSKGYRCYAGIIMQAGNNLVLASQFEENFENVQMAPGENDGHGSFVGCSLNHAVGIGLNALDIANGHVFQGCQMWFAPIQLTNCTGIRITQSQIRYSPVTVTGGGLNMIDDNWVGSGGLPRTFSGSTFTTFRRNRTTSTDNTIDEAFGDLWVTANALSIGSSFTWNATSDTAMTPDFEYLRYHGVESSFLDASGRVYIPKSMRVRIDVRIVFATAGAAERPVVKAVRRSFGGTVMETAVASVEAPSSRGECTLNLSTEMICNNGDSLEFTLRSLTGTGITVAAGGFRLVVSSAVD